MVGRFAWTARRRTVGWRKLFQLFQLFQKKHICFAEKMKNDL